MCTWKRCGSSERSSSAFERMRRRSYPLVRAEFVLARDYEPRLSDFPTLRDPKDAHVLAAALAAGCDLIVTGDWTFSKWAEWGKR